MREKRKAVWKVRAVSINKETLQKVDSPKAEHWETIYSDNELFNGVVHRKPKTKEDVKQIYESFWDMDEYSTDKVIVLEVKKVLK